MAVYYATAYGGRGATHRHYFAPAGPRRKHRSRQQPQYAPVLGRSRKRHLTATSHFRRHTEDDPMKLYFVRHGESEANVARIISNREQPHALTSNGIRQAHALADSLQ